MDKNNNMMLSDFENLTNIFPDICLYEVVEREYENGGWTSKAEFCNAYKFDEDGLAQKIQRAANERLWQQEERETQLLKECAALREQLAAAETQAERFTDENDKIKADMFNVMEQYVRDDVDPSDIGRAVVAYVDLLDWSALHR